MIEMISYSVVVPVFNRLDLLDRAIISIQRQTLPCQEILIVDDASTDGTATALERKTFRGRVIRHSQNLGAAAARNTGILNASHPWIAFLDSDDEWSPQKIEAQFDALARAGPEAKVSTTGYTLNDIRHGCMSTFLADSESTDHRMLTFGCTLSLGSTLLVHRDVFANVGFFDPELRRHEDWDWAIRCTKRYNFVGVPAPLATIHKKDDPNHSTVLPALKLIRTKHLSYWSSVSVSAARRFRASLLLEEAAGLYYSRKYLRAAFRVSRALAISPYRNVNFFWMLGRVARKLASPTAWF